MVMVMVVIGDGGQGDHGDGGYVMVTLLARIGMDDEEAVALIGGGHGVGKAQGTCPLGEDPFNPWPERCGAASWSWLPPPDTPTRALLSVLDPNIFLCTQNHVRVLQL